MPVTMDNAASAAPAVNDVVATQQPQPQDTQNTEDAPSYYLVLVHLLLLPTGSPKKTRPPWNSTSTNTIGGAM